VKFFIAIGAIRLDDFLSGVRDDVDRIFIAYFAE